MLTGVNKFLLVSWTLEAIFGIGFVVVGYRLIDEFSRENEIYWVLAIWFDVNFFVLFYTFLKIKTVQIYLDYENTEEMLARKLKLHELSSICLAFILFCFIVAREVYSTRYPLILYTVYWLIFIPVLIYLG